jgi:thiazole synthase
LEIVVNGAARTARPDATVASLLLELGIAPERVAVERNLDIVTRERFPDTPLTEGDRIEIIQFVGGGSAGGGADGTRPGTADALTIAGITFRSRLWVGTGKYKDFAQTKAAIEASGADVVTVAVRRVNITDPAKENLLDFLDPKVYKILPNTAGCYTAEEAIRTARLARAAGVSDMVKLEVIGDEKTLLPDNQATLEAARVLVHEGFIVLPYMTDDVIMAKRFEDAGCAAVMPLAAPIGSGLGVCNPHTIRLIREAVRCPVVVDAGVGTASDVAVAMEMGVEAVLLNTAIAGARDPIRMATAMRHAVIAGREAYLAGRIPKKPYATASSPEAGRIAAAS